MHDPLSAKLEALTTELHWAYTGISGPITPSSDLLHGYPCRLKPKVR